MKLKSLKTWLAGTATLLTIMATNVAHAQAATDATAETDADATMSSASSVKPAKQVTLSSSSSSSQASSSSSQSSSAVSASSSSASQSSGTPVTKAADTKSVTADTTAAPAEDRSGQPATNSSDDLVSSQDKSQSALDANQQKTTTMYSAVTTSQKGSASTNNLATTRQGLLKINPEMLSLLSTTPTTKEIPVEGIDAAGASITSYDKKTVYGDNDVLSVYSTYWANYHWLIKNGITINDGDTTTLTLPNKVVFSAGDTNIPLKFDG